jgi:RNA methyltransferase, TrmH family
MANTERITSLQNPRVKRLVKLRERKHRESEGLILLDEPRVIRRALDAGISFTEVYVSPEADTPEDADLAAELAGAGAETIELAPSVMAKAAYRDRPAGVLALATQPTRTLDELDLPADALVIVLENVEKPGNLGAVVRTASGAGVDAVLACGIGADPWNPNALRASTGAVFSVPVIAADATEIVATLRERGLALTATTPDTDTLYTDLDLTGPTALLLGAEDRGLTPVLLNAADHACRIPMNGTADSLNVSVSAAILAYEARRQRDRG